MVDLSVIVPVFRTEKHLGRCLDSVLGQEQNNIEVIVVDDHSSGRCEKLVREYRKLDSRIRYIRHRQNRGLLAARLSGINSSVGEYVTHLDPDDWIGYDTYASALNMAKERGSTMVMFNVSVVGANGRLSQEFKKTIPELDECRNTDILNPIFRHMGRQWVWHVSWNKIWKAELVKRACRELKIKRHVVMCEDLLLSVHILSFMGPREICSTINTTDGVFYFRHDESTTRRQKTPESAFKNIQDLSIVADHIRDLRLRGQLMQSGRDVQALVSDLGSRNFPSVRYLTGNPLYYFKMCLVYALRIDAFGLLTVNVKKASDLLKTTLR